jgi:hypothetical protein
VAPHAAPDTPRAVTTQPETQVEAPAVPAHAERLVPTDLVGNKGNRKYHRPDCKYLPTGENRVDLKSAKEAKTLGYLPCGHCKPPE